MKTSSYTLCCHGCGRFHEKRAIFLSTPLGVSLPGSGDGCYWTIPQAGCPECIAMPNIDRSGPIARAYDHGMTEEAKARMLAEWPAIRAGLEAARATT